MQNVSTTITIPCRFSYVHVFEPAKVNESDTEAKYSAVLLIDKKNEEVIKKIKEAVRQAALDGKNKKFGGKDITAFIPKWTEKVLRDGDIERPDTDGYQGMLFINAKSKNKPGICKPKRDSSGRAMRREDGRVINEEILDEEEFYSGCYGQANITFFAYNQAGGKGIAASLNLVRKLQEGEKFGNAASIDSGFADADDMVSDDPLDMNNAPDGFEDF